MNLIVGGGLETQRSAGRLTLAWVKSISGLVRTPLFDPLEKDRAFVIVFDEKRRVYDVNAFRVSDGGTLWALSIASGGYGAPTILDDVIITPSSFTNLVALRTDDGRPAWEFVTHTRIRSPLVVIDGRVFGSSGDKLFGLTNIGSVAFEASIRGAFLFGACGAFSDGTIVTLGTNYFKDGSHLFLYAFDPSGVLAWSRDLGLSNVASSDTAGVLVHDDVAYVGTANLVRAIDGTGKDCWVSAVIGAAHRSICTADTKRIYVTTVDGCLTALDRESGETHWSRLLTPEGIWMPATVAADRLLVVADGVLHALDPETGATLQQVAVGESPYSACVVRDEDALLGGGDPPYFGLLLGFKLRTADSLIRCHVESCNLTVRGDEPLYFAITATGTSEPLDAMTINLSSLGGDANATPLRRDANTFMFAVQPITGRRVGAYALPVRFSIGGKDYLDTVHLRLIDANPLPSRVFLSDVTVSVQEAQNFSGAACLQALRGLYGQDVEQHEMRKLVDTILRRSPGYGPFEIWRIIARRALLSSARTADQLPELNANRKCG